MSLVGDPLYEHSGRVYDLTVDEVASRYDRSRSWVHAHRSELGGVQMVWDDGKRALRFSSNEIDERIFLIGS